MIHGQARMTDESANTTPGADVGSGALPAAHPFDIAGVRERLAERGGYEVVHSTPGLEIGVYVLVAPEPDRQQPHADDEIYVVLGGSGMLDVDGRQVELHEGQAVFVPAGAEHRFVGYEHLSVLVVFDKRRPAAP
jgi:mannose-6-phosphate isomerase-like protein (cupin superfamily)